MKMKTKIPMIIWVTTIIYLKKATRLKNQALQTLMITYKMIWLISEIKLTYLISVESQPDESKLL